MTHNSLGVLVRLYKSQTVLPGFFSWSPHALFEELLPLLLHDLLLSQALVAILNHLLHRRRWLTLLGFDRLSCRSWRGRVIR